MKKLVSILLALALILALSTTAFATEVTTTRTYDCYKLLDLNISQKSNCGHTGEEAHTETCYVYQYSVNEKYKDILQDQAGEGNDILTYLASLTSDSSSTEFGTLHDVAEDIYAAILDAKTIDPDKTLTDTANIDQGYWLFVDVTDLEGKNEANSFVIVDTKGQDSLTITPKTSLPTVVKKVLDKNDTIGAEADAWQDSADHDIGDKVSFKLTATLPANFADYTSYKLVFHDTLSADLTLDVDSIVVTVGGNKTNAFTYAAGDDEFTLTCENIKEISGIDKNSVIEVTYNATLNENAVIGSAGNPNEVYLEFSNNPYDEGTGNTKTDKVIVFTYKLVINKTNSNNQPLKGAGFKLYKKDAQGNYDPIGDELKGENMTTFEWKGLDDGDYKLEESTVPAGYNKMTDIEFTISAAHDVVSDDPALTSLDGGQMGTGVVDTGAITKDIENHTGSVLPETGAEGTFFLITGGTLLAMVAVVFMITRKKMSIYED